MQDAVMAVRKRPSSAALDVDRSIRRRTETWDLTLGTDFAGMEIPRIALESCGFVTRHRFMCEKNYSCRKLIQYMWPDVEFTFKDITCRDPMEVPHVDLYVAGVPCQPWSAAGERRGLQDPRGQLWRHVMEYISSRKPKTVILENVKGLGCERFEHVLHAILHDLTRCGYRHWHKVLDTQDHALPQHRKRLYNVAVCQDLCPPSQEFKWPEPLPCLSLKRLLGNGVPSLPPYGASRDMVVKALQRLDLRDPDFDLSARSLVVDVGCSKKHLSYMVDRFPTITATRASTFGYWIVDLGRQATLRDFFLLQGIQPGTIPYTAANVGERRVAHMLGNSMSCNVLERLLPRVLAMVKVYPSRPRRDPWALLGTHR